MRSKAEIEQTLAHMKTNCTSAPAVNEVWIQALEWVLGDDAHKAAYQEWLEYIDPAEQHSIITPRELTVRLFMALERLR